MPILEGKDPSERKKMIAALALGVCALFALGYLFLGSSSSKPSSNSNSKKASASPTQQGPTGRPTPDDSIIPAPLSVNYTPPAAPEAGRNIFAFYVPPPPTPTPVKPPPVPSPTPPPPMMLNSVSPANVFARTGDFKLDVMGDKFTPAVRIYVGDVELPTKFISAQQLSANVPAALISGEGARQISVKTPDGQLYSNMATLNVQSPPTPNYIYVGIIGDRHHVDTAILKDKNSRELLNVQRGDTVGGNRFRVTSISDKEVALTDMQLKIKHTLPLTNDNSAQGNPGGQPRYQPPTGDDEEP